MNTRSTDQDGQQQPGKRRIFRKFLVFLTIVILLGAMIVGYFLYSAFFLPNIRTPKQQDFILLIRTNSGFTEVKKELYDNAIIIDRESFIWLANQKKYPQKIRPGRYVIKNGMSNQQLIDLLRSGAQSPIKLTFNNVRDIKQLAGRISKQIEADSNAILSLLNDKQTVSNMGFTKESLPAMFIPNTYEFYWTTNAAGFVSRMSKEYKNFWNDSRKAKAKAIHLSPVEVSTLASIIDRETAVNSEKPAIAGVYLNRLKSGWLLQADPTLIFAVGDFSIKRVLDIHKQVESKYNTYKYPGLPPGPICVPSISSIDAVLNPQKHEYFYFCAKDDFSGTHAFARTYNEHIVNARKFQQALNKQKIYK
ncbi:MAG: endolytic transglycosylase MltG [Bacteroidales bacterium]|nr:endolytic transglycosylase MltG [Bacteroidales bacterium]